MKHLIYGFLFGSVFSGTTVDGFVELAGGFAAFGAGLATFAGGTTAFGAGLVVFAGGFAAFVAGLSVVDPG